MKKVIRSVHQYIKDTDKILWLLCIACSAMSVITLCSQMFYGFITSKVVITQSLATGIEMCIRDRGKGGLLKPGQR